MQTTELFVEQVLIGLLVLVAGILVVSPDAIKAIEKLSPEEGVLLVGGAYLIGIVYDRFADTLLDDLLRHHRLLMGLREWSARCKKRGVSAEIEIPYKDPFAEDELRLGLGGEKLDEANYLRSRIRLTRALVTVLPALSVGVVLYYADAAVRDALWCPLFLLLLVLYALPFLGAVFTREGLRTEDLTERQTYKDYRKAIGYSDAVKAPRGGDVVLILHSKAGWSVMVFSIVAVILVYTAGGGELSFIPIGGFIAILVAGWSWWRITRTFYKLLATAKASEEKP